MPQCSNRRFRSICRFLFLLVAFGCALIGRGTSTAAAQSPAQIQVQSQVQSQRQQSLEFVGSTADSLAFRALEQPFVNRILADRSFAVVKMELRAASEAELIGRDLLDRTSSGKVGFTALRVTQFSPTEAWFDLADLTGLALDVPSARLVAAGYRDRAATLFQEKFGLRLLALAAVQAQALYCRSSFARLADIKGRKIRTDGAMQAALIESLGGSAHRMPLAEVRSALASKTIDCAIGGTMTGNQARWHEVSSHLFSLPLAWELIHYAVAEKTWASLPPTERQALQSEFRNFEARVWESALVYTREGINCNAGVEPCRSGQAGRMNVVIGGDSDRAALLKTMNESVLPAWSSRCAGACSSTFNQTLAKLVGMKSIK